MMTSSGVNAGWQGFPSCPGWLLMTLMYPPIGHATGTALTLNRQAVKFCSAVRAWGLAMGMGWLLLSQCSTLGLRSTRSRCGGGEQKNAEVQ